MALLTFHEIQRFRQWWLWAIIILTTVGMMLFIGTAFYRQIILGEPYGDRPMPDSGLILFTILTPAFVILIAVMMYHARLETKIERYGISYRFSPFIREWKFIPREAIREWKVTRYIPPGYGIRIGFRFLTFNVSGNMGLELKLDNRKNIRLGTQRPREMEVAMEKMFTPESE